MIQAVIAAMALLLTPTDPTALKGYVQKPQPPLKQEQGPPTVSASAVADYLRWTSHRKKGEVKEVTEKAVALFPRGATIENYPDSVGDPTSKQSMRLSTFITTQLERDGIKVGDVETLSLFSGDNGLVQVEVILVVSKVSRRVAGVYQGWYGR